jgi:hypothetical protein
MPFDSIGGRNNRSRMGQAGRRGQRIFHTAVVCDFYSNPKNLSIPIIRDLNENSHNPEYIDRMPRNSISAFLTSDRRGKGSKKIILYPFFSPHLCLPVKPGEQVWVIFEKTGPSQTLGYWLTRKCVDYDVDDLNYTHADRMTQRYIVESNGDTSEIDGPIMIPSFPTGATGRKSSRTLNNEIAYEQIVRESVAFGSDPSVVGTEGLESRNEFIGEPVPRFSKAVGDLVIQGSNNSAIVLGTDRRREVNPGPDTYDGSSPFPGGQPASKQGSIDLVVGRGQTAVTAAAYSTAGVPNTRRYFEIAKRPKFEIGPGRTENSNEGDPDFINDLSRVYMSMKSNGDLNFMASYPETSDGVLTSLISDAPYIVLKSSENRIISRSSGSVRLVKEGTADENKAVIMMLSDGTVMIDGPKIIVGSGIESSNGEGSQVFLGRDATEPIVLGNQLKDLLSQFFDDLKTFLVSEFDTHVHPVPTGGSGPPVFPSESFQASVDTAQEDLINVLSKNGMTK